MFLAKVLAGTEIHGSRKAVSQVHAGEAIVVPIRGTSNHSGSVYTFNQSGTTIWNMLEAGRSEAEVAAYLQFEYEISAEQAVADTREFLLALVEEGLIDLA